MNKSIKDFNTLISEYSNENHFVDKTNEKELLRNIEELSIIGICEEWCDAYAYSCVDTTDITVYIIAVSHYSEIEIYHFKVKNRE